MLRDWRRRIGPYQEILRAIRDNSDRPGYALRILRHGVCDGCALGTAGLRDWTMPGIHLCWLRLNLLRLNTMPAFEPEALADASRLAEMDEAGLRRLGRIPRPMIRRRGEPGFTPLSWDEALALAADGIRETDPRRLGFYVVSRGTVNETYYVAQKAARALGTSHVDNSARVCHAPSTVGLKRSIGFAATTCSYSDLIGTDLVVLVGSNVANNQPVMMKYLHLARKQGTRIAVVNPFREPGLERYWVPSSVDSALFGTKIADEWFHVDVGGDVAFVCGVLKLMIERGWCDDEFIARRTTGWDALVRDLEGRDLGELERLSGASRERMLAFARLYSEARTAVIVWSMGITMHRHGVDGVRALANLGLARGNVGRAKTGLMPIRGHSGVQGGAEMGCVPNLLPGGVPVDPDSAARLSGAYGFDVPSWKGSYVAELVDRAHEGRLDALWCVGSNLAGILPDSAYVRDAVGRIPLRVHHDIVFNPSMLVEPAGAVLVLPATTRYEVAGGCTETTTERRVIYSPEIPGPRVAEARDEWRVLAELVARARPERAEALGWPGTAAIREEIARVVPSYRGIEELRREGDQFQWGGPRLAEDGAFPLPGGRARFVCLEPPRRELPPGCFRLTTRRGKQFNSMVLGGTDMLVAAGRSAVVMAEEDLGALGLVDGDAVVVESGTGRLEGRARSGPIARRTVMVYWPEANALIPRAVVDPDCGMPAYRDAVVTVRHA